MSDLPKSIQVIFENNPMLTKLLPNPVLISESPFISAFSHKLSQSSNGSEQDDFYKIVFKKDSSRDLMAINNGELKGLLTTTCIEKGKISDVAGLEKVTIDNESDLMPTLLGISLYGSIQANLSYISQLCVDIRNHQIVEEQARFEGISDVIVDSFKSIPDISLDRALRDAYLSRIVNNNTDCYKLYISQRLKLQTLLGSKPSPYSVGYNRYFLDNNNCQFYPADFFEKEVLNHPVFAVFERLVAGRICEIVMSGNYSDSNIQRHKDFIFRIKSELEELIKNRLAAFDNFTRELEDRINTDLSLTGYDRNDLNAQLTLHNTFVKQMKERIFNLLDTKLDGFNLLSYLMDQNEIEIVILDGKLLINNHNAALPPPSKI